MRIIINGKLDAHEIEDAIYNAYNMALDVIEKENNDLYKDIAACHGIDVALYGVGFIWYNDYRPVLRVQIHSSFC